MGRREKPVDPAEGPVQRFAFELRKLRQEAGAPTYRAMAQSAEYSVTALAYAVAGEKLPSLPVALAYAGACGGDPEEWERRWREAAQEEAALPPEGDETAEPPYRGLARYEPGDRALFFGRSQLTNTLVRLVGEHRFTAIVGPSGSGKSSLLRAGLIPALRQGTSPQAPLAGIRILTPGAHPVQAHASALRPKDGQGDTLVVVDQFEEVFTLCRDPGERAQFIEQLLAAQDPAGRLRVVLGVRADFYGRFLEHGQLAAAAQEASLPVGPMTPAELREAIVKPAAAQGLIVERALTARLIDEVADEPGALPLLSHALLETWRRRKGRSLTVQAYEASGGVTGALARTAEDLYTQLPADHADLTRRILLRLIAPGDGVPDTRRPIACTELGPGNATATDRVLDQLAAARLITLDHDTVDLAHEAVITSWPRLHSWIEEDRERLRIHRRLTEAATAWAELGRDAGALYRGTRLSLAEEHFPGHHELSELESTFLTASLTARDQERRAAARTTRRLRRFTVALSVLLALTVTAGVIAWQQSLRSERERDRALAAQRVTLSRQLAAQSGALHDSDPDLAALLAVRAYRTDPTPAATTSLYAAADLPLRHRLTGYTKPVDAVAFSPDGQTLATGSDDRTVRLRDAATGTPRTTLTGHTDEVATLAFSPDGQTLATGSKDKTLRLWDTASHKTRAVLTGHTKGVYTVAFSPDGRTVATGSIDKTVRLWDTATGKPRATLTGHDAEVSAVAFSPDGRTLATSSKDKTVRLWDVASRRTRTTLTGHTDTVAAVAFSPDGRTVATGSHDETVRLWDAATGKTRDTLTGYRKGVLAVEFSPDGQTLAIANYSHVQLRDTASGKRRATLAGHAAPIFGMAFSPNGRTLATGSVDKTVRLWDATVRKTRATLAGHTAEVATVAFSPNGHTLATGSWDKTVRLWDAGTGKARATLTGHTGPVYAVAFSPDGRSVASGGGEKSIRLWDVASGTMKAKFTGHDDVYAVAFSPDGRTLATAGNDKTVRLWDTATRRSHRPLRHDRPVATVAFGPDGRTLATGTTDGTVRLWNTSTGKRRSTLTGHGNTVAAVAFQPGSRNLASGSWDKTARLWDTATGKTRTAFTGHTDDIQALAFSPNGQTLATGGTDQTVRLWDAATGKTRTTLTGHANTVAAVAFSPNGRTLATGSYDKTVRLWDVDLPTPSESIRTICRAVHRDLTRLERSTYLPDQPHHPVCAP
ncbi:hypothetical protein AB0B50_38950 [Streptomyces sp. NPDC041068]|uniref:nSTAND1 domain-containing NTPase n=1 Tax=Streptomyces sp. NPDC041068 TaxID=3155130 RepID=UPI0033C27646